MSLPPLSLTDHQHAIIAAAVASLPPEKHGTFLDRVAAELRNRTADVQDAVTRALDGLVQSVA